MPSIAVLRSVAPSIALAMLSGSFLRWPTRSISSPGSP